MTTKTSIITILHGEEEFIPLIKSNYNNFLDKDLLELVIVDDGGKNLIRHFSDLDNIIYLHLSEEEIEKFTNQIHESFNQPNKSYLYYEKLRNRLPNGS